MARRRTHTELWWENHTDPTVIRCAAHLKTTGERCRSEAAPGTSVCEKHGALVPAVQQAAATRIQMSVDEASKRLVEWLNDNSVDMRERVKIAHDLLDRGGLGATQKHLLGVVSNDPVETLFRDLLTTPGMLAEPRTEVRQIDGVVEGEVVEETIDPNDDGRRLAAASSRCVRQEADEAR